MHLEKQCHAEVVGLLKDQVSFLKNELSHKNLIIELSTRSNNGSRSCSDFNNNSNNASHLSSANYTLFFFIRIYFIRKLKMKWDKKLRIS